MKRLAYNKARDANEPEIVDFLRKAGCSVVLMDKPVDLLVGFRRNTFLVEIKVGNGELTIDQAKFQADWRGDMVWIIRSVDDARKTLTHWRKFA